jgi:hypothetical protein
VRYRRDALDSWMLLHERRTNHVHAAKGAQR